jgi:integration host factor subunit alpha
VKLSGFGTFSVRDKRARVGRNPRTGEAAPISPRRVVTFRASAVLKRQIAEGQARAVKRAMDDCA